MSITKDNITLHFTLTFLDVNNTGLQQQPKSAAAHNISARHDSAGETEVYVDELPELYPNDPFPYEAFIGFAIILGFSVVYTLLIYVVQWLMNEHRQKLARSMLETKARSGGDDLVASRVTCVYCAKREEAARAKKSAAAAATPAAEHDHYVCVCAKNAACVQEIVEQVVQPHSTCDKMLVAGGIAQPPIAVLCPCGSVQTSDISIQTCTS